jgi:hypothetical protein
MMSELTAYDQAFEILAPIVGGIETYKIYFQYSNIFYENNRSKFPYSIKGNEDFVAAQENAFLCDVVKNYKIRGRCMDIKLFTKSNGFKKQTTTSENEQEVEAHAESVENGIY